MAYDYSLANRVREYLSEVTGIHIEEKSMFGGLAFMVNGKMCINVSGNQLMCRYDPQLIEQLSEKTGFQPMIMNGKMLNGYCYVDKIGYESNRNFEFWIKLCLDYNDKAVSSKKKSS
ncbi:TfoX/Sxy family protein [Dyadobacter chenwenxiniae]|uniref:TfoX/Sxy family protein n=1 Tax=Dyadobacter chenwenxiniae TaxID=2906456 RepID=A0A9X1PL81_9BACT|nr:TfoX/Sxy family protein [Dyadobacter chenwenxiniae]MCF0050672.1 TfoX/Sxy family protein [Dyadobacter chenwenxiniae]MCF0063165.1 TfoX/Sxy family protein [Dyadobacter chenwenxiniae]UON84667.1 TfoX/Sxy family protein [Dyadobacter chenwenxiniae]